MKIVVEIEMENHSLADLDRYHDEFFSHGDERISIDASYLPVDPKDDSFVLLTFLGARP